MSMPTIDPELQPEAGGGPGEKMENAQEALYQAEDKAIGLAQGVERQRAKFWAPVAEWLQRVWDKMSKTS